MATPAVLSAHPVLRRAVPARGAHLSAAPSELRLTFVVHAFSPTALIFGGITAAIGVFSAWLHLASWPAIWKTNYGRTLLVKLVLLSGVVGTGAYNWLRVRASLGDGGGAHRIRRSAGIELAIALLVLAVTAVLVATPPPADMS